MNRLFITFSLLIGLALPAVATATIYISTNLTEPVDTDFLHFYKKNLYSMDCKDNLQLQNMFIDDFYKMSFCLENETKVIEKLSASWLRVNNLQSNKLFIAIYQLWKSDIFSITILGGFLLGFHIHNKSKQQSCLSFNLLESDK